jgi:hypothetical protein
MVRERVGFKGIFLKKAAASLIPSKKREKYKSAAGAPAARCDD